MSRQELDDVLGTFDQQQSKSGTGYSSNTGGLNGQGNSPSQVDNSADNLYNN